MDGDIVSVERIIEAPAARIFEYLADAAKHSEIDGSGTVQGTGAPSTPLTMGSTFGMSMKMGVPYKMINRVIEFEPDRRIAWQTAFAGLLGKLVGGRIWRYVLEPVDGGARTRVTESWDISKDRQKFALRGMATKTRDNMAATLERLAKVVEGSA